MPEFQQRKSPGPKIGVFTGVWTNDYERRSTSRTPGRISTRPREGRYAASGRLAYFLDLLHPNLPLDTASASSLVAIHLACQSLRPVRARWL